MKDPCAMNWRCIIFAVIVLLTARLVGCMSQAQLHAVRESSSRIFPSDAPRTASASGDNDGLQSGNDKETEANLIAPPITVARRETISGHQMLQEKLLEGGGSPASVSAAEDQAFEPPYPHRTNPFLRPDSRQFVTSENQWTDQITPVQLKGFIKVGTPRVLLAIDGNVLAVQEGQERAGVRVITIDPPQVVLQRGSIRWAEKLYSADTPGTVVAE